jgi:hypothetical protein
VVARGLLAGDAHVEAIAAGEEPDLDVSTGSATRRSLRARRSGASDSGTEYSAAMRTAA